MIRGMVLRALGRAADRGTSIVSAELHVRGEPLLRGAARHHLHHISIAARAQTTLTDEPHVVRVAYLVAAGAPPAAPDDAEGVANAYARARRGRRGVGFWWISVPLVLLIAGGIALGVRMLGELGRRPPAAAAAPPAGAFAAGGIPTKPSDEAVRALRALPEYAVALDEWARARRGSSVALTRTESALVRARRAATDAAPALGPGGARRVETLLGEATAVAEGAADAPFLAAAAALDDELAAAGLGLVIDVDVVTLAPGRRTVLIEPFTVDRVTLYRAGDAVVRTLHARRVYPLSLRLPVMGLTRPHLPGSLIVLDELEEWIIGAVLPAMVDGQPLVLVESERGDFAERAAVEARAGELVRSELGVVLGADRAAATATGEALAKRAHVFAQWRTMAQRRGLDVAEPEGLRLADGWRADLGRVAPKGALDELAALDTQLGDKAAAAAVAATMSAFIPSIELHEAQHRLDFDAARTDDRVRHELSAYLAQIHRDARTPRLALTLLSRYLFDPARWGTPEARAAAVLFEGLARELDMPGPPPLIVDKRLDRAAVAAVYQALTDAPPERLREAAAKMWQKLFGAPLPPLVRVAPP